MWILATALAVALVVFTPAVSDRTIDADMGTDRIEAPEVPGCSPATAWVSSWYPDVGASDAELRASYFCNGTYLHLAAFLFDPVRQGREAVARINRIIDPNLASEPLATIRSPREWEVREYVLDRHPGQRMTVWTWYNVNGTNVATEGGAKLHEFWHALRLRPVRSLILIVATNGPATHQNDALMAAMESISDLPALRD